MIWPFSLLKREKDKKVVKDLENQAKDIVKEIVKPPPLKAAELIYKTAIKKSVKEDFGVNPK